MKLIGAPRLRRQRARRYAAVRQAIDTIGRTVNMRTWSLPPARYARFLDLYLGDDELGAAETDELDQLWAWCVAGFGAPAVAVWLRTPGPVSTRPRPHLPPPSPPPAG